MVKAAEPGGVAGVGGATDMYSGQCLCGAVTYQAQNLRDIWFCHCIQCRRATGHFMAACRTERNNLSVDGQIIWSTHSGMSQIGRCAVCGSPIFWQHPDLPTISVTAGSLDNTNGLTVSGHIYIAEKGDYYDLPGDMDQWSHHPDGGC